MLDPQRDRLDYGDLLNPPAGCHLEAAVATTYSLDLTALMSAVLRLGAGLSERGDGKTNPVDMKLGISRVAKKLVVFCDANGIKVPSLGVSNEARALHALLDEIVVGVNLGKKKAMPAFHPKMWLLRFRKKDGGCCWRLIVLSRNLTFDRSWDVVASFDGQETGNDVDAKKTNDLRDLLNGLVGEVKADETRKLVKEMAKAVSKVKFTAGKGRRRDGNDFRLSEVLAWAGKKEDRYDRVFGKERWQDIVVVSPFLSKEVFREISTRFSCAEGVEGAAHPTRMLVSSREALLKLGKEGASGFDCYALKDDASPSEDAVDAEDGQNVEVRPVGLHAKMIFMQSGEKANLLLGSMNATNSGFCGNAEMMVRLEPKNKCGVRDFVRGIFGLDKKSEGDEAWPPVPDEKCPFEKWNWALAGDVPSGESQDEKDANKALRELSRLKFSGIVVKCEGCADGGDACYDIELKDDDHEGCDHWEKETGANAKFAPLCKPGCVSDFTGAMKFPGLRAEELSQFFVVEVSKGETTVKRVLRVALDHFLHEERERSVKKMVVNSPEKLARYLQLMTAVDPDAFREDADAPRSKRRGSSDYAGAALLVGQYEDMLRMSVRHPEFIDEMKRLLEGIELRDRDGESGDVAWVGRFKAMCEVFEAAMRSRAKKGRTVRKTKGADV